MGLGRVVSKGCMNKLFAVRQVCENYLENGKDVFWAFMDLEQAYDRIDRHVMYQMLRVYGDERKLLKSVQSYYVDNRECVRVGMYMSQWFPINVGFRQGCVMSLWLFNVYMDGVVREVNFGVLGKGLKLLNVNSGRFKINKLLFADNTALVADSEKKLCKRCVSLLEYAKEQI